MDPHFRAKAWIKTRGPPNIHTSEPNLGSKRLLAPRFGAKAWIHTSQPKSGSNLRVGPQPKLGSTLQSQSLYLNVQDKPWIHNSEPKLGSARDSQTLDPHCQGQAFMTHSPNTHPHSGAEAWIRTLESNLGSTLQSQSLGPNFRANPCKHFLAFVFY